MRVNRKARRSGGATFTRANQNHAQAAPVATCAAGHTTPASLGFNWDCEYIRALVRRTVDAMYQPTPTDSELWAQEAAREAETLKPSASFQRAVWTRYTSAEHYDAVHGAAVDMLFPDRE